MPNERTRRSNERNTYEPWLPVRRLSNLNVLQLPHEGALFSNHMCVALGVLTVCDMETACQMPGKPRIRQLISLHEVAAALCLFDRPGIRFV